MAAAAEVAASPLLSPHLSPLPNASVPSLSLNNASVPSLSLSPSPLNSLATRNVNNGKGVDAGGAKAATAVNSLSQPGRLGSWASQSEKEEEGEKGTAAGGTATKDTATKGAKKDVEMEKKRYADA